MLLFLRNVRNVLFVFLPRDKKSEEEVHQPTKSTAMNKVVQEFVFGYGSLICPVSRALTAPALAEKTVTPVLVKHVERTWAKRCWGMTAMGVRFKDDARCVGVLLPVNNHELKQFDRREYGYDRVPLYLGDVEKVPFLDDSCYEAKEHEIFLKAKERQHAIRVWMYLQQESARLIQTRS